MTKKRRQFSPEKKISILREHLVEKVSVPDVCEKHELKPSVFYGWQKKLFENGADVLVSGRVGSAEKKLSHQVDVLGDKLKRKDEVIAEIMEEHIALKKELGEH
jgi:transposase-like protein